MGEWLIPIVLKTIINYVYREFESCIICIYKKMMAQKINATGLRVKKKLNWNAVFSVHDYKNYADFTVKNTQLNAATNAILSKFNLYSNNLFITHNSKTTNITTSLINEQQIYKKTKLFLHHLAWKSKNEPQIQTDVKKAYFLTTATNYQFTKAFTRDKNNKLSNILLTPQILVHFIENLVRKNARAKYGMDTSNLAVSLPLLIKNFLSAFKSNISGIKVIVSGKWRRTRTGRKQKLCLKYGTVRNANLSSMIRFYYITQKTKYGACGLKVWVAQKRATV